MSIDVTLFKRIMRRFPTGVMVLTVPDGEGQHAITVNAVTSVSLNPILMLVCIEKNAQSHRLVHAAGRFVLNILSEEQAEMGERFAYDREARSHPEAYGDGFLGATGALVFKDSLGYLECRVTEVFPGGDHTIFIAEVIGGDLEETGAGPLIYSQGRFSSIGR